MTDKKKLPPEQEPKIKMYRLRIDENIEAESIDEARNGAPERLKFVALDKKKIESSLSRVVKAKYSSRADRLAEAHGMIESARGIVEELKGEIQEWYDNLPENLQGSDKGSAL